MKIIIGGDFVITKEYPTNYIDDQIVDFFRSADYSILNLEAPITANAMKIVKTGPHLKAQKECTLDILKLLNVKLVTLANNHIKDYGEKGVLDTIHYCKSSGIETVGAGKDLDDASQIFTFQTEEGRISIINIAENEWASATCASAGANGMNLIKDVKKIQEARGYSDFVFVIIHGGHEYYNLPSPRMQEQYRFYVEQGADLVVGHHTHCISGYESYQGVPIYYSLGNFLFTSGNSNEDWYAGLVLQIEIKNGELISDLIPLEQKKETFRLSVTGGESKKKVLQKIQDLNLIINNEVKLVEAWKKYILTKSKTYLNYWSPYTFVKSKYIKIIARKLQLISMNKSGVALWLNLMRCEAHSDISKEVLSEYLQK